MGVDLVPHLVHAQCLADASRPAVADRAGGLTYQALDVRARRLAGRLRQLGAGRDVLVGITLDRSVDFFVAALGTLYAGAAYVPIDPAYPADRIAFMLADAAPAVVISDARLARRLPRGTWHALTIDAAASSDDALASEMCGADATADGLAYVIYTSGSTGRPKGVEITHGSLVNLVRWHQRAFAVTPPDRASQLASPGFDAAVWEIWPYLA